MTHAHDQLNSTRVRVQCGITRISDRSTPNRKPSVSLRVVARGLLARRRPFGTARAPVSFIQKGFLRVSVAMDVHRSMSRAPM